MRVVLFLFFVASLLFSNSLDSLLNSLERAAQNSANYKDYKSSMQRAEDEIFKLKDKSKKRSI